MPFFLCGRTSSVSPESPNTQGTHARPDGTFVSPLLRRGSEAADVDGYDGHRDGRVLEHGDRDGAVGQSAEQTALVMTDHHEVHRVREGEQALRGSPMADRERRRDVGELRPMPATASLRASRVRTSSTSSAGTTVAGVVDATTSHTLCITVSGRCAAWPGGTRT